MKIPQEAPITPEALLTLIRKAAAEKWHEFVLRGKGITELPSEIGQLQNLSRLDLSFNRFNHLPPEILNLRMVSPISIFSSALQDHYRHLRYQR